MLIEIYRYVRRYWLRQLLEKKKKEKRPKPPVLRPESEHDKLPRLPVLPRSEWETNYYTRDNWFGPVGGQLLDPQQLEMIT